MFEFKELTLQENLIISVCFGLFWILAALITGLPWLGALFGYLWTLVAQYHSIVKIKSKEEILHTYFFSNMAVFSMVYWSVMSDLRLGSEAEIAQSTIHLNIPFSKGLLFGFIVAALFEVFYQTRPRKAFIEIRHVEGQTYKINVQGGHRTFQDCLRYLETDLWNSDEEVWNAVYKTLKSHDIREFQVEMTKSDGDTRVEYSICGTWT